jgi:hypothetical protein
MSSDAQTGVAALTETALDGGAAATPPLPNAIELRPFEPDLKAVGAIERALRAAAGDNGWERVARALGPVLLSPPPTKTEQALSGAAEALSDLVFGDPRVKFCVGLVEGSAEGILDELKAQVRFFGDVLGGLVDFYAFVYDINVLAALFEIWFQDPVGSPTTELETYLKSDYPQLWSAIVNARPLVQGLDKIVAQLRDSEQSSSTAASIALEAIGDWIDRIPETLGGALRPHLDAIVKAEGSPKEQGAIIGRVAAPVILQVVLAALDLANLARHAARFLAEEGPLLLKQVRNLAREALESAQQATRGAFRAEELASVAAKAEKVAPGIAPAASGVANGVLRQLTQEWGELGYRIAPYRLNSKETGAWNKAVRKFANLTTKDTEFAISLRLDSNHIIEDQWFDKFTDEFKKVFKDWAVLDARGNPLFVDGQPLVVSWKSAKDMDAIAIHTEAHIRSGTQMAKQGLLGADGRPPLNPEMNAFFAKYRQEKLGGREFANLAEVIEAHKRFYQQERTTTLWPRLSAWFDRAEAALAKASK